MRSSPQKPWWYGVVWGAIIWLVVPAGLFVLGYNVIGPRIGTVPALNSKVGGLARHLANADGGEQAQESPTEPEPDTVSPKAGVPQVEVDVTASKPRRQEAKEAPKRRARAKPAEDVPKEEPKEEPKEVRKPTRDAASGETATPPPSGDTDPPAQDPGTGSTGGG